MSSVVESMGGAVEGGLLARALEPDHGSPGHGGDAPAGADGHTHESACLNCGTRLQGDYCHRCGQHAHVHRTLGAFGHDLLHGVLHLEGKIWRTLPMLMFRPGELTRRYIAGERARFVSPLALFLFSVFLMFGVMSFLGSPMDMMTEGEGGAEAKAEFRREQGELQSKLARLRQERATAASRGMKTSELDGDIRSTEKAVEILGDMAGDPEPEPPRAASGQQEIASRSVGKTKASLTVEPDSTLNTAYKAAKKNPKLLIYKLQTNAYKFSWALILISVPFVGLLFLWRWRPLYDHTVFVTHSITAVSILTIVGSLLVLAGVKGQPVMIGAMLFIPWHMYRQLRGGYGLRRFSALWRTALLLVFAAIAISLFAFGLLALGVLG